MAEYEGQRFHNRTLELDGQSFRRCHFINCQFRFHGRDAFVFEGNRMEGAFWIHLLDDWRSMPDAIDPLRRELHRYGAHLDEALAPREEDWKSRGKYVAYLNQPELHIEFWFQREGTLASGLTPVEPGVDEA